MLRSGGARCSGLKRAEGRAWRAPISTQKKERNDIKTYNSRDSLVVTHPTTNRPACGLSTAERTGSPVLHTLWSYVTVLTKDRSISRLLPELLLCLQASFWLQLGGGVNGMHRIFYICGNPDVKHTQPDNFNPSRGKPDLALGLCTWQIYIYSARPYLWDSPAHIQAKIRNRKTHSNPLESIPPT